ncbi:PqqD family protein [Spongiactinospora sp. TRM90649]|uniref:PqqD family protein n=1 Tax=Spongiactinospora sp. TRM90649 TaxID=3031114 RepID=UPI0023F77CB2|nr:PqqD family protein [Spongiactinospora sp. TRM90649]MDF5759116.1 PqqD family protein [Spongiactinospora sp. TRM90649]
MSLRISDAVVWQETADGISLYHTETGDFRTLNETGSRIWMLVASDGEREPVGTKLSHEFAGTHTGMLRRILTDVDEFIGSMVENGFIEESAQEIAEEARA